MDTINKIANSLKDHTKHVQPKTNFWTKAKRQYQKETSLLRQSYVNVKLQSVMRVLTFKIF